MSTITILLIIAGIAVVLFFIWIINRTVVRSAVKEAVSNAKPTSIYHGNVTINNFGQPPNAGTEIEDTYLQISQCAGSFAGEFAKQLLPKPEEKVRASSKPRQRKKVN